MHKEAREELRVRFKLMLLEYASYFGVIETCREFEIPRASFYRWKKKFDSEGRAGLYRKTPLLISILAKHLPMLLRKSRNYGKNIN